MRFHSVGESSQGIFTSTYRLTQDGQLLEVGSPIIHWSEALVSYHCSTEFYVNCRYGGWIYGHVVAIYEPMRVCQKGLVKYTTHDYFDYFVITKNNSDLQSRMNYQKNAL